MKAVGEVMGIGRSFQEAIHKATQSLEIKRNGLGADGKGYKDYNTIIEKLKYPSWDRVFVLYDAIQIGISLKRIHEITKIDMWFLKQYEELNILEKEISKIQKELPRIEGKLNNPKFIDKAPEEVIAKEKEKLAVLHSSQRNLEEQLVKIKAL